MDRNNDDTGSLNELETSKNYFISTNKKKSEEEISKLAYLAQKKAIGDIPPEFRYSLTRNLQEELNIWDKERVDEEGKGRINFSFTAIPLVIYFMRAPHLDKLVYTFLAGLTVYKLGRVFPSRSYIGKFLGRSQDSIEDSINRLKQRGLIYTLDMESPAKGHYYLLAEINKVFLPIAYGGELIPPRNAQWEHWVSILEELPEYYKQSEEAYKRRRKLHEHKGESPPKGKENTPSSVGKNYDRKNNKKLGYKFCENGEEKLKEGSTPYKEHSSISPHEKQLH